jgi:hypothetical protein
VEFQLFESHDVGNVEARIDLLLVYETEHVLQIHLF